MSTLLERLKSGVAGVREAAGDSFGDTVRNVRTALQPATPTTPTTQPVYTAKAPSGATGSWDTPVTTPKREIRTTNSSVPTPTTPTPTMSPSPTVTPTPAATVASNTGGETSEQRYERVTKARQDEIDRLNGILRGPTTLEPDMDKIREDLMKNNQALIDSITSSYANTIASEREAGNARNSRTRATNVGSGLAGSDFAGKNAINVEEKNQKVIQSIEAERDAKVQSVLANVDFTAQKMFEEEQGKFRKSAEDQLARMSEFKDQALADVASFAGAGISSTSLKEQSPETWQNLLKQTGYSEQALSAMFAASKPQDTKIFQEKVGNSVVLGYRDPQTGKVTTEKIELADGFSDFKIIDDQPYFVDMEGGRIVPASGFTPKPKAAPASATYKSGSLVIPKAKLTEGEQALETSRGEDGYVDPAVYKGLYDDWIAEGGLLKDFLTNFPPKNYVNPVNNTLPPTLRSAAKSKTNDDVL